jgi:hypothetical protein
MQRVEHKLAAASGSFALHTSYFGSGHPSQLSAEMDAFETRFGARPETIRSHYLRMDPLLYPRLLESSGVRIDSTVAFAEQEGFRRGTCLPYRLFDLASMSATGVWEMPLALMDSSLFHYRGLDAAAARDALDAVLNTCKVHHGVCVLLFHNIIYDPELKAWHDLFEYALDRIRSAGPLTYTLPKTLETWLNALA